MQNCKALGKNVAHETAVLLKLNRFVLGSIREPLKQKERVARATFCAKWKSTSAKTLGFCRRYAFHDLVFQIFTFIFVIENSSHFPCSKHHKDVCPPSWEISSALNDVKGIF